MGLDNLHNLLLLMKKTGMERPALMVHVSGLLSAGDLRGFAGIIAPQLDTWQGLFLYIDHLTTVQPSYSWIGSCLSLYGGNPLELASQAYKGIPTPKKAYFHLLAARQIEYNHSCEDLLKAYVPKAEQYLNDPQLCARHPEAAFYAGLLLLEDDEEGDALRCWATIRDRYPMAAVMHTLIKEKRVLHHPAITPLPVGEGHALSLDVMTDLAVLERYHNRELVCHYARENGIKCEEQMPIWEAFTLDEDVLHRLHGERFKALWTAQIVEHSRTLTEDEKKDLHGKLEEGGYEMYKFLEDLKGQTTEEDITARLGRSIQDWKFPGYYPHLIYFFFLKGKLGRKSMFMLLLYEAITCKYIKNHGFVKNAIDNVFYLLLES